MCKVSDVKTRKRVGYKVVVKENGKYYSKPTGIEYKESSMVCGLSKERVGTVGGDNIPLSDKRSQHYNEKMVGRTSVLTSVESAERVKRYFWGNCIVKMKLKGTCYEGNFGGMDTIVGSEIATIEELK